MLDELIEIIIKFTPLQLKMFLEHETTKKILQLQEEAESFPQEDP